MVAHLKPVFQVILQDSGSFKEVNGHYQPLPGVSRACKGKLPTCNTPASSLSIFALLATLEVQLPANSISRPSIQETSKVTYERDAIRITWSWSPCDQQLFHKISFTVYGLWSPCCHKSLPVSMVKIQNQVSNPANQIKSSPWAQHFLSPLAELFGLCWILHDGQQVSCAEKVVSNLPDYQVGKKHFIQSLSLWLKS